MAIAIVEELWTRIRAAIDDKIVDATTAAESAEADRVVVEQAAMSASWSGDRLTVLGATSPPLAGENGPAGETPYVGANGNWWVGDTDTGVRAQGEKGDPGDGAGDVLWSELNPVLDGKAAVSHDHTAAQISDATTVGSDVLKASSQEVARQAIGAGTSNLALGTTSTTAKAGDYQPASANISDSTATGRAVLTAADAAAARTVIGAAESGHTHSEYATTTQMEARTPEIRIVSTIPTSPTPGVVYLRFG